MSSQKERRKNFEYYLGLANTCLVAFTLLLLLNWLATGLGLIAAYLWLRHRWPEDSWGKRIGKIIGIAFFAWIIVPAAYIGAIYNAVRFYTR